MRKSIRTIWREGRKACAHLVLKQKKYTCLTCKEYFCTVCCVFENDENVLGWKQGRSVAYCELCFHKKLGKEMISGDQTNDQSNSKRRNTSTMEWLKSVLECQMGLMGQLYQILISNIDLS